MYNEKIEAVKADMAAMIDAAKEEGRALNDEELATAAAKKAELDQLRKSAELEALATEWKETEKAEIRKARRVPEAAPQADEVADAKRALLNYIQRGQVEGTGAYGGYLVPDRLLDWVVAKRDAESYVRRLGTVINIDGPTKIPVEGSDATAYWTQEAAAYTDTTQSFTQAALTPYKLTVLDKISEELIASTSFDVVGYLIGKIARIIGQTEETAFIKGSTASYEPEGILSAGITVTRTAANNAVTAAEIQGLFYDLAPQYQRTASWLISGDLAAKLSALTTGTGGIFAWGGNLADGAPATLMGRPCYISKDLDPVTTNKIVAVLGSWEYYYVGDQGGLRIQRMDEAFAASGQVGLRFTEFVGGVCTNTAAFRVLGTKTT